jgi:hypothetical protein
MTSRGTLRMADNQHHTDMCLSLTRPSRSCQDARSSLTEAIGWNTAARIALVRWGVSRSLGAGTRPSHLSGACSCRRTGIHFAGTCARVSQFHYADRACRGLP